MDHVHFGARQPLRQLFLTIFVHEKADRAAVHAVNGDMRAHEVMQRLQHEAVAAERDDDIGVFGRRIAITRRKPGARLLGLGGVAGDEGDASDRESRCRKP